MKRFFVFLAVLGVLVAQPARSDELRPGYLELRQTDPAPTACFSRSRRGAKTCGSRSMSTCPKALWMSGRRGLRSATAPMSNAAPSAGMAGSPDMRSRIEGLSATSTDVLVRIETLAGAIQTERLSPTRTAFVVQAAPGAGEVAATYLRLGVEHILFGFDHLLFVLALVILVRDWRRVAVTVTAFTIAHSITLAAATLGFVNVPGPPVEATIALSIMLVSVEILNARHGKPSLTARLPWLVAFSFGLLHGFGFAGALAEVGLPQHAIPVALLFFNVGVEIGQLVFVAAVLSLIWSLRHAASQLCEAALVKRSFDRLDVAIAYGIGVVAAYWLIERTTAFFA